MCGPSHVRRSASRSFAAVAASLPFPSSLCSDPETVVLCLNARQIGLFRIGPRTAKLSSPAQHNTVRRRSPSHFELTAFILLSPAARPSPTKQSNSLVVRGRVTPPASFGIRWSRNWPTASVHVMHRSPKWMLCPCPVVVRGMIIRAQT